MNVECILMLVNGLDKTLSAQIDELMDFGKGFHICRVEVVDYIEGGFGKTIHDSIYHNNHEYKTIFVSEGMKEGDKRVDVVDELNKITGCDIVVGGKVIRKDVDGNVGYTDYYAEGKFEQTVYVSVGEIRHTTNNIVVNEDNIGAHMNIIREKMLVKATLSAARTIMGAIPSTGIESAYINITIV